MDTTKIQYGGLTQNEKLLFSQFRRKINVEAAQSQVKKLEYNLCDVTVGVNNIKCACADGNAVGLGGICVLPAYVKQCSAFLGTPRKCRLIACVGYPHGGDVTAIKVKAVKRAVKDGADEIEVTAPVAQIRDGNFSYVRREFKKLRKAAKKRALRIDAECSYLSKDEVIKVSLLAADCGADSIKTNSGVFPGGNGAEMLSDIKSAVKDKCGIKVEGVATVLEMSGALDTGANVIGSRNAADVARTILSAAESDI